MSAFPRGCIWMLALALALFCGRGWAQENDQAAAGTSAEEDAPEQASAPESDSGSMVEAADFGLKDPKSQSAEIAKAQDLLKAGDVAGAKEALRPLLSQAGASAEEACLRLAQLYLSEGNTTDCLSLCDKGVRQFAGASAAQLYCIAGDCRIKEGKKEEASLAYLRVALVFAKSRFHAEALFKAATTMEELGQKDRASELRAELLQLHPDSPWASKTSPSPESTNNASEEGAKEDGTNSGL